jgi:CxxC motif-containing protein (DUF1111 family)
MLGGILSKTVKFVSVLSLAVLSFAGMAFAQTAVDKGVQAGNRCQTVAFNGTNFQVCTGSPMASVQGDTPAGIAAFFADGLARFQDVEAVSGHNNNGLGPRFNFNQCSGCHAAPAVGGTGPAVNPEFAGVGSCASVSNLSETAASPVSTFTAGKTFTPIPNTPQVGTIACSNTNTIPSFLTKNGPTLEVRFPFFFNANGTANTNNPNGGVETIFTVSGRPDGATQAGCSLQQPGFAAAANANNIIFRIPTPTFGMGLMENIDDSTLLANRQKNLSNNLGITGDFNHNGNDGTISRFGWKAQNKSGHIFAGEAYNVEMGISNLLFTQDRPLPGEDGNGGENNTGFPAACLNLTGTGYPEDSNNPQPGNTTNSASSVLDDASAFANFMRTLAPPVPGGVSGVSASSISNGKSLFTSIGCAVCHNPTAGNTQASNVTPSLSQQPVNAFTDFEFHHMGTGLADNVSQGGAGGDQFRSAPLWGLGQRIFLLHDGRTTDLVAAIEAHSSSGSEANQVETNYDALSASQQQDLLNFLRSL